ncbi:MAG: cytochrome c [Pseudomonadota bacterium]|nr:cytochrome c [Pseudomonadota bacterium]
MKQLFVSLIILGGFLITVPSHAQMGYMQGRTVTDMSRIRHQYVMRNGLDPRYASRINPLKATSGNIKAGKQLYDQNCALCHGAAGLGNGAAGQNLNPPATDIAVFSKTPMATDGYLFWTISEGGVPLGTAMPPFKNTLSEEDIWKIILYLRQL